MEKSIKILICAENAEERKKIADAIKDLYSIFGTDIVDWVASLYDPEAGAWYHSRSVQMTEGYGPDA